MQGWMEYIIKALHDNSSDLVGNILVDFKKYIEFSIRALPQMDYCSK